MKIFVQPLSFKNYARIDKGADETFLFTLTKGAVAMTISGLAAYAGPKFFFGICSWTKMVLKEGVKKVASFEND